MFLIILPMLAGRQYIQWLGKPDSELGPLLDCLGSLCPWERLAFAHLWKEMCVSMQNLNCLVFTFLYDFAGNLQSTGF